MAVFILISRMLSELVVSGFIAFHRATMLYLRLSDSLMGEGGSYLVPIYTPIHSSSYI